MECRPLVWDPLALAVVVHQQKSAAHAASTAPLQVRCLNCLAHSYSIPAFKDKGNPTMIDS